MSCCPSPSLSERSPLSASATRSAPPNARAFGSVVWCRWAIKPRIERSQSLQMKPKRSVIFSVATCDLGSLNLLLTDLRRTGVKTKLRPLSNGRIIGGIAFTRGSLAAFLRNCFYIGEVRYKGEVFPGEQSAILDRALFDAVQSKLDRQRTNHAKARQQSQSLLMGRIFDERDNRMTPSYAVKNAVRYRYYISAALVQGQPDKAAKLNRVPASEIEKLILSAVRKHLAGKTHNKTEAEGPDSLSDKELISTHIARVDVKRDHLAIQLTAKFERESEARDRRRSAEQDQPVHRDSNVLVVPWKKTPSKRPREIILPASTASHPDPRPIRAETRAKLVSAIAKGRHWLDELIAGMVTNVEQIAATENCTVRQVNMMISLAFLAPSLVQAAIDGRLPRGVGIANLRDAPAEWSLQYARLGLAS